MVKIIKRWPWLITVAQWFAIGACGSAALSNAATDHGVLMAVNCFCLGIVVWGMLLGKRVEYVMKVMNETREEMERITQMADAAYDKFREAVAQGRIEVVPIQPWEMPDDKPTQH